jgi:hypothetical protein
LKNKEGEKAIGTGNEREKLNATVRKEKIPNRKLLPSKSREKKTRIKKNGP